MNLQKLFQYFCDLYGHRNRVFMSNLSDRIVFLNLAMGDLQDAIRKNFPGEILDIAFARVVSRIFCVAENFKDLPWVEYMCRKYPELCSYCSQSPCQCPELRKDYTLAGAEKVKGQTEWSLTDWCNHLDLLYAKRNKDKEIENVINRLFKEISEIMSVSALSRNKNAEITEIEKEFSLEIADCLAWTIGAANLLKVDLEKAVLNRYGQGCLNCRQNPCNCSFFNHEQVNWSALADLLFLKDN